jgi:hypothetical protein
VNRIRVGPNEQLHDSIMRRYAEKRKRKMY